jgi:hypothetical protein
MSDKTTFVPAAREEVALKLTDQLYNFEASRKAVPMDNAEEHRKYYLDLYAECLEATSNRRTFG